MSSARPDRRMAAAIHRRIIADERGMTLVEMVVGFAAGMVVLLLGYSMWNAATAGQTRVTDRIDAVARGRVGMERITREIRSQQCLDSATPAMMWASDMGMQFYASVAQENVGPAASGGGLLAQPIERRRIEWVQQPNLQDSSVPVGDLVETVWTTRQSAPPYAFIDPPRKQVLAEDVESDPSVPMFRYTGYDTGQVGRPSATPFPMVANAAAVASPWGRGVSAANLPRIVLIDIRYNARARRQKISRTSVIPFANRVSVRTADPSDPTRSPLCL